MADPILWFSDRLHDIVDDINGDKINDLLFPYFYVYANTNYLVFCQNKNNN